MRRRNVATVIGFAGFALIVVALVGSLGAFVYREMGAMRQRDALNLLNLSLIHISEPTRH